MRIIINKLYNSIHHHLIAHHSLLRSAAASLAAWSDRAAVGHRLQAIAGVLRARVWELVRMLELLLELVRVRCCYLRIFPGAKAVR